MYYFLLFCSGYWKLVVFVWDIDDYTCTHYQITTAFLLCISGNNTTTPASLVISLRSKTSSLYVAYPSAYVPLDKHVDPSQYYFIIWQYLDCSLVLWIRDSLHSIFFENRIPFLNTPVEIAYPTFVYVPLCL